PSSGSDRRPKSPNCPAQVERHALRCAGTGEGMSPSFMKKTMVYLGLLDDEYDEYDDLEDRAPRGFSAATSRVEARPATPEYDQAPAEEFSGGMSRVRTIPRESAVPAQPKVTAATITPPPSPVGGLPADSTV